MRTVSDSVSFLIRFAFADDITLQWPGPTTWALTVSIRKPIRPAWSLYRNLLYVIVSTRKENDCVLQDFKHGRQIWVVLVLSCSLPYRNLCPAVNNMYVSEFPPSHFALFYPCCIFSNCGKWTMGSRFGSFQSAVSAKRVQYLQMRIEWRVSPENRPNWLQ